MSNTHINDLLSGIAEAKRAYDAEPEYRRRIAEHEHNAHRMGETIAERELRIHNLKQENEALQQKLRSVEAERDEAGFRALEEADRVSSLSALVRQFITDGLKVLAAAEQKPEAVVISRGDFNELKELRYQRGEWEQEQNELEKEIVGLTMELQGAKMALEEANTIVKKAVEAPFVVTSSPLEPIASSTGESNSSQASGESAADPIASWTEAPSQTALGTGTVRPWSGETTVQNEEGVTSNLDGDAPAADPFASKADTQSPSVSSSTAGESESAASLGLPETRDYRF